MIRYVTETLDGQIKYILPLTWIQAITVHNIRSDVWYLILLLSPQPILISRWDQKKQAALFLVVETR